MKTIYRAGLMVSLLASTPAYADDAAMMQQLRDMQKQMEAMQKQIGSLEKELDAAKRQKTAAPAAAATGNVKASSDEEVKVTMGPGLKFETADGEYSLKFGGFAQVDAGVFQDDRTDHPDGANVRRARLNVSGNLTKDFKYKLENDFANNASAITDAYLEFVGIKNVSIMVGQFKEPFGLETLTSDLFTTFTERSLTYAFSPDRNIGVAVGTYGSSAIGAWTATIGGFGSGTGVASTDDEAKDLTGRVTLAPIAQKDKVLHFGLAGSHRIPDSATDSYRVRSQPENRLTSIQAVDTGAITGVDSVNLVGLEAAGVLGPASVQGEYVVADINTNSGLNEPTFSGFYAEASYFLTGESRNYVANQGRFDRVAPKDPFSFSKGGWGAWQLAIRYSSLDLDDALITGGEIDNITLGVRWYPNANVTMLANYIMTDTDNDAVSPNDDPRAWILRTQFDF